VTDTVRRAVLILGILAVIVGIGVADAGTGPVGGSTTGGRSPASSTAVPRAGAESSAWFCAGGTAAGGDGQATMLLTNPTPRAVTGTVTTVSTNAPALSMTVPVPARTQTVVAPAAGSPGGSSASTVVFTGGGIGVSQVLSGPLGFTNAPCASTTASHWYFADGSTAAGDTLTLSLFNPTDTVSVVDVSFVVSTGLVAPPAYQGIDVPADTLVTENIGDHVQNNPHVATMVTSLSGEVVAAELGAVGPAGSGGPSVVLGATTPSTTWSFAQNTDVTNGSTVFHVFNPSDRSARVTVKIGLEQGQAEPVVMNVPAGSVSTLDTATLARLPVNVPFALTFESGGRRSGGGVGIIVDREVISPSGAAAPEVGEVAGVAGSALQWLLPAEYSPSTGVSTLAVMDLSKGPVTVRLSTVSADGLVPVTGFKDVRVRPGTPLTVTPGPAVPVGTEPMEIVSSGPVAVELDAVPVGSPGVVVSPALPLG
jgi:uncharacterized protein DUF5719